MTAAETALVGDEDAEEVELSEEEDKFWWVADVEATAKEVGGGENDLLEDDEVEGSGTDIEEDGTAVPSLLAGKANDG